MPFSGVHITVRYAAPRDSRGQTTPIVKKAINSQSMSSEGLSNLRLPSGDVKNGEACYRVVSTLNVFVSIGESPDAVNGPRDYIQAGQEYDIGGEAGDRIAWATA